ncbi:MAG TPA: prepilin-type N-terminal cleavage/methylation domain-containing protein [Gemmatimonadales bacterium]
MLNRRGFTLVEIMLATTTMLIVSGAVYQLLVTAQRLSRTQAAQLGVQTNVRGAVLAVLNELRELSSVEGGSGAQNDLLSTTPGAMIYRAMRGTGFTCQPATESEVRISRTSFSGHREPQVGRDSVLLYLVAAPETVPAWTPAAITGVSTVASCPGVIGSGITLTVSPTAGLVGTGAGTPVRFYEIMELRLYQSDGQSWLGTRSISAGESIQPLFGPLTGPEGFRLTYLGASGLPTNNPTAIKSIEVTARGTSVGVPSFELSGQVALRNAWR